MIKTKQELLNHFSDINAMYNNPFMYQTLSNMIDELFVSWLSSFNTDSATECFTAVQQLKEKLNGQMD